MPYVTYTISGITRAPGRAQITSNNNTDVHQQRRPGKEKDVRTTIRETETE
jgi:hypothetical protein